MGQSPVFGITFSFLAAFWAIYRAIVSESHNIVNCIATRRGLAFQLPLGTAAAALSPGEGASSRTTGMT